MTNITIARPDPPSLVQELAPIVAQAQAFEVTDAATHGEALKRVKSLRLAERGVTEHFEPARKAADAAKKELLALRDGFVTPMAEARGIYERTATEYEREEQRKAAAERKRLEDEARRKEEDARLRQAIAAESAGDDALAEKIIETPAAPRPVIVPRPAVASVSGVTAVTRWSAEVTDIGALVRHVATHPDLLHLISPNLVALNQMARAQQAKLAIPGVRAVSETSHSVRS